MCICLSKAATASDHLNRMVREPESNIGRSVSSACRCWGAHPWDFVPHFRYSVEISLVLCKTKLHCCVYESPLLDAFITQINRCHVLKQCFLKIQFNIITPRLSMFALSFRTSDQTSVCFSRPSRARFCSFMNRKGFEFPGYAFFLFTPVAFHIFNFK